MRTVASTSIQIRFYCPLSRPDCKYFFRTKTKKNQKKYLHRKRLIRLPEIETNLFLEVCNRNLPLLIFVNKFSFFPGSGFLETDNVDPNNTDQNNAETSNVKINEKHFKY